jgi:Ran GTPase-activating protein (RanGAP) involved in mRNA processing and transport
LGDEWKELDRQCFEINYRCIIRNEVTDYTLKECYEKCECLNLTGNKITDDSVNYLANMLKTNPNLTRLYLGNNEITQSGVKKICKVLTKGNGNNMTLTHLHLNNNPIGYMGIYYLKQMLKRNKTLKELFVGGLDELDSQNLMTLITPDDDRVVLNTYQQIDANVPMNYYYCS